MGSWDWEATDSLEDDPRFGCSATATSDENVDCVHHIEADDRGLTKNKITKIISIFLLRLEKILHVKVFKVKVSARWVTHVLASEQKHIYLITSLGNLRLSATDPVDFFERFLSQRKENNEFSGNSTPPLLQRRPWSLSSTEKMITTVLRDAKSIRFLWLWGFIWASAALNVFVILSSSVNFERIILIEVIDWEGLSGTAWFCLEIVCSSCCFSWLTFGKCLKTFTFRWGCRCVIFSRYFDKLGWWLCC